MKKLVIENKAYSFNITNDNYLSPSPHFHRHIEIIYVRNGQATAYADQKKRVIKSGDLFIAFPNQIHYYEKSVYGEYVVCTFSPDVIFELTGTLLDNVPKKNILSIDENFPGCSLLTNFENITGDFSKTERIGLLNLLFANIMPRLELTRRIKTNNSTLQEVLDFCQNNYTEDISLEDIANALHISKFHISHLLNNKLGLGLNSYLNSIRIRNACDLLTDTELKIADISEEVGFGSIRSFNRAFKETMDMTPLDYRSKL